MEVVEVEVVRCEPSVLVARSVSASRLLAALIDLGLSSEDADDTWLLYSRKAAGREAPRRRCTAVR